MIAPGVHRFRTNNESVHGGSDLGREGASVRRRSGGPGLEHVEVTLGVEPVLPLDPQVPDLAADLQVHHGCTAAPFG